jgi:hypothetical protein
MALTSATVFSDPRYADPLTSLMAGFLAGVGLDTAPAALSGAGFLEGLTISHGVLLVDEAHLAHPGDLLHEAGHLAVVPGAQRKLLHGNVGSDPGEEMAAIAWSYAAALYLGIDPALIFHSEGYSGGSQAILLNFSQGRYFGVPMLEWFGLAADKKTAALLQVSRYPYMVKWLRD